MWSIVAFVMLFLGIPAFAQDASNVSVLQSASIIGSEFHFSYVVGTHPSEHESKVSVSLVKEQDASAYYKAVVSIQDVSAHSGKAYFIKYNGVDLRLTIDAAKQDLAKKLDLNPETIRVYSIELPGIGNSKLTGQ